MAAAPLVKLNHTTLVPQDPQKLPQFVLKSVVMVIIYIKSQIHVMMAIIRLVMGKLKINELKFFRCSSTCTVETGYSCSGGSSS
jgi:hypothetical protein